MTQNLSEADVVLFKKWLQTHLEIGSVTVTFIKKDGSERVMKCTTAPSLVAMDTVPPVHLSNTDTPIDFPTVKKERKLNPDVCPVYDLESQHWKSFRWDSVKSVSFELRHAIAT